MFYPYLRSTSLHQVQSLYFSFLYCDFRQEFCVSGTHLFCPFNVLGFVDVSSLSLPAVLNLPTLFGTPSHALINQPGLAVPQSSMLHIIAIQTYCEIAAEPGLSAANIPCRVRRCSREHESLLRREKTHDIYLKSRIKHHLEEYM